MVVVVAAVGRVGVVVGSGTRRADRVWGRDLLDILVCGLWVRASRRERDGWGKGVAVCAM